MQQLAARHDDLIREAIEARRGRVVKTTGDGFHAIFDAATDAAAAALEGQKAMVAESWPVDTGPLQVRMGLHTGKSREREGDYYGSEVNRAARIMGVAHGGQILVSAATAALLRTTPPPEVTLADPDLIEERVAAALGVQEQPGRVLPESLVDFLRRKDLLLLLDDVEHVVRECAEIVEHLLRHCPKLKILVTGREALFIGGEVTLQIPSLSLPPRNGKGDLDQIRASEAVQLFLTRAQEYCPEFEIGAANAGTIAEIVRRLDGIPLALELATARLRLLSVNQISERLDDRFRLLTGGRRTALAGQQTLQAMIDWSWNLLDDRERLLLRRLSVFSGGWSMEAAQSVAADDKLDEYDVFDLLEQLFGKSLVTVRYTVTGEARYGMLEGIRQYGRDRLLESGEGEILRGRHAGYYVAFAEKAGPHQRRSTMMPWLGRIIAELDNLRAVMVWTLEERPPSARRLSGVAVA